MRVVHGSYWCNYREISWGECKLGQIGVDHIVISQWSIEVPEAFAVVRAVLIVLI